MIFFSLKTKMHLDLIPWPPGQKNPTLRGWDQNIFGILTPSKLVFGPRGHELKLRSNFCFFHFLKKGEVKISIAGVGEKIGIKLCE